MTDAGTMPGGVLRATVERDPLASGRYPRWRCVMEDREAGHARRGRSERHRPRRRRDQPDGPVRVRMPDRRRQPDDEALRSDTRLSLRSANGPSVGGIPAWKRIEGDHEARGADGRARAHDKLRKPNEDEVPGSERRSSEQGKEGHAICEDGYASRKPEPAERLVCRRAPNNSQSLMRDTAPRP